MERSFQASSTGCQRVTRIARGQLVGLDERPHDSFGLPRPRPRCPRTGRAASRRGDHHAASETVPRPVVEIERAAARGSSSRPSSSSSSTSTRNPSSMAATLSADPRVFPHDATIPRHDAPDPAPRVVPADREDVAVDELADQRRARRRLRRVVERVHPLRADRAAPGAAQRPRSSPPRRRSSGSARPCAPGSAPTRRRPSSPERARCRVEKLEAIDEWLHAPAGCAGGRGFERANSSASRCTR